MARLVSPRVSLALVLLGVLILVSVPFWLKGFLLYQLAMILCMAIAVMGLNIVVGYGGQLSLGHGAVFAIGAYVTAVLMDSGGLPWPVAVALASLCCLVFGVLFGWPALRLQGHHLALATFALALAMPQILKHRSLSDWTGGVQGVMVFGDGPPDWFPFAREGYLYCIVLLCFLAAFTGTHLLFRARMGRAIVAVRENPVAAASMGVNLTRIKLSTFALSCLLTGLAGALYTLLVEYVSPDSFGLMKSIHLLVAVVVGGAGTILGPIIGALFIQLVPGIAEQISQSAASAVYAVILLGVVLFLPKGLAGALGDLLRRLAARR